MRGRGEGIELEGPCGYLLPLYAQIKELSGRLEGAEARAENAEEALSTTKSALEVHGTTS
jgi:hypothetical protein